MEKERRRRSRLSGNANEARKRRLARGEAVALGAEDQLLGRWPEEATRCKRIERTPSRNDAAGMVWANGKAR